VKAAGGGCRDKESEDARYLISFNEGAMDHISDERDTRRGQGRARGDAGGRERRRVVYGAGLERQRASLVATDGAVTDGPFPETKEVIGGFAVVETAAREEAVAWAAKIAAACPLYAGGPGALARRRTGRDAPPGRQPKVTSDAR
jgi:hypothetical protein